MYCPHPFGPPHWGDMLLSVMSTNLDLWEEKLGLTSLSCLQSLGTAIAATKVLSAQQVVKNEAGEEVNGPLILYWLKKLRCQHKFALSLLFSAQVYVPLSSSGAHVQQNSALPDYLPEDEESPQREVERAISRTAAKEDSNGSWLNAAASFLTKTFYWWSCGGADCRVVLWRTLQAGGDHMSSVTN